MIQIERKVWFQTDKPKSAPRKAKDGAGRIPRVSRLMALAIRFDQLIRDGVVADQAELARLGHVTRARLTQIMNLLNLAPDIQEEILWLPPVDSGRDEVAERELRPIAAVSSWRKQRQMWRTGSRCYGSHQSTTGNMHSLLAH